MSGKPTVSEMVTALKYMMAPEDRSADFTMPSLLQEVPSYNSSDSNPKRMVIDYAELGGRSQRNI